MAERLKVHRRVYSDFEREIVSEEDLLQFMLGMTKPYCDTTAKLNVVTWLESVGMNYVNMKSTMPKQVREDWSREWYVDVLSEAIRAIIGLRISLSQRMDKVSRHYLFLDAYSKVMSNLEVYAWGRVSKTQHSELEEQYYSCLLVGKEIKQAIPEVAPLILTEREDQGTLMCASDAVEGAGYDKSATHLRCGQKHLWNCSVFKGILGTV